MWILIVIGMSGFGFTQEFSNLVKCQQARAAVIEVSQVVQMISFCVPK